MDEDLQTNMPSGGVSASNMLMGNTTVSENSTTPQLTPSEYFTPPINTKEYDGTIIRIMTQNDMLCFNWKQFCRLYKLHCLLLREGKESVFIMCITIGIGHPVEVYNRVQNLKATVWLAEEHSLSLHDQIMPVIDLMVCHMTSY